MSTLGTLGDEQSIITSSDIQGGASVATTNIDAAASVIHTSLSHETHGTETPNQEEDAQSAQCDTARKQLKELLNSMNWLAPGSKSHLQSIVDKQPDSESSSQLKARSFEKANTWSLTFLNLFLPVDELFSSAYLDQYAEAIALALEADRTITEVDLTAVPLQEKQAKLIAATVITLERHVAVKFLFTGSGVKKVNGIFKRLTKATKDLKNELDRKAARLEDNKKAMTELKGKHSRECERRWALQLEEVFNLNIPSSRFTNKKPHKDVGGNPVRGAFGALYKAELADHPVALKQLTEVTERPRVTDILSSVDGSQDFSDHLKRILREARILLSLRHPNIVHFLGLTHDEQSHTLAFVLSWAENGSLYDVLHVVKKQLDEATRHRIAFEVACAMAFLHAHNVVHRDLKSPNVLLDASLSAKVTDFGMSTFKPTDKSVLTHGGGTPLWASPEQLLGQELRMDTDVFSFAVLLWELLFNTKPWHHGNYASASGASLIVIANAYDKGEYLPLNAEINGRRLSHAVQQVLGQCFDVGGNRPSFVQLQGTLQDQYVAVRDQQAVDMAKQHRLLHGPADAVWKWQPKDLDPLRSLFVTHPTRASVRIAAVGAAHDTAIAIVKQMITEAGGRSSDEATANPLQPFGKTVVGVAVVQCSQKNAAFNGAVHRNQTRYRGHMSSANHPFHPKYALQMGEDGKLLPSGIPVNAEKSAVLARVTLHPPPTTAATASAPPYKLLDQFMMQPDVRLRLQRVFHGVPSFAVAMSILGGDFAQLQKLDAGWYGAGFYFTPDLDCALEYSRACHDVPDVLRNLNLPAGKQLRVVLVCDVQYGNPYPVLNTSFNGKPLVRTHDAHVAVVNFSTGNILHAKPLKSSKWASKRTAAEIVINDPSCVLVRGILVFEDDTPASQPSSSTP
ncbi:TKL protein kinase [Salpingoeca rosetta]|uniref:TKL protein kinase n=1 Tax=Salpingoeca rosetta (strain ATCC 50818 / BSB-021) TaxID=946362 RepID=F2UBK3_SALR5|nr:TKL protein kinase [Salpingoeca rosetta]EGD73869.1 TKL protein kinase [Salpingoeca rosetta]|eukprot:XP_004993432.1 TKL protein kinase [Salpingoeca rosetta]